MVDIYETLTDYYNEKSDKLFSKILTYSAEMLIAEYDLPKGFVSVNKDFICIDNNRFDIDFRSLVLSYSYLAPNKSYLIERFHFDIKKLFLRCFKKYVSVKLSGNNTDNEDDVFGEDETKIIDINYYDNLKQSINDGLVYSENARAINGILLKNPHLLVVSGNSSSGKTVSVLQALENLDEDDYVVSWIDMSSINTSYENIAYSIIRNCKDERFHYFIFDNAHAKPAEISDIITLCNNIVSNFGIRLGIVLISWPSATNLLVSYAKNKGLVVFQYFCNSKMLIQEMIRAKGYNQFEENILFDSKEDALVSDNILNYLQENNGKYPTPDELNKSIFRKCTRNINLSHMAQDCLYTIAALGEFEIHIKEKYLSNKFGEGFLNLKEQEIVRIYTDENSKDFVYLGHRSMANKVANYLCKLNKSYPTPDEIALSYLKTNGESLIHSMLERLDNEVINSDNVFANLWKAFSSVRSSLYKKVNNDPIWGTNMASMIFSAEALADISKFDKRAVKFWDKQAKEIRSRWQIDEAFNLKYTGEDKCFANGKTYNMSSEIVDFTENIKATMAQEENKIVYEQDMLSENIDCYKFHDNWLLGLLLGFEGNACYMDDQMAQKNKEAYIRCAELRQAVDGSFYPRRVSWVTARIIMGLTACDQNYYNSEVVKRACEWLADKYCNEIDSEGITFDCGGWVSGTGSWNSDIQIMLMNLEALHKAGYPITLSGKIVKTVNYIIKNASRLAEKIPNSLDLIWIIDLLKSNKVNLLNVSPIIKDLSQKTIEIWDSTADKNSFEKQTESSDVSFMAKELLSIMWNVVEENIGSLLKGLEQESSKTTHNKEIFISYRRVEGGGSLFSKEIYDGIDKKYKDDTFLDIVSMRHECSDFNIIIEEAILNAKVVIIIVSDNVFDRCLEPDYDMSKDVFIMEILTAIKNNKHIIVVYNNKPELPEKLKANPRCYQIAEDLTRYNSVIYYSGSENAKQIMLNSILDKLAPIINGKDIN